MALAAATVSAAVINKTTTVNEGQNASPTCVAEGGTINIVNATYGELAVPANTCSYTAFTAAACNGQTNCVVNANNGVCGDPIFGTGKQLNIAYQCITPDQQSTADSTNIQSMQNSITTSVATTSGGVIGSAIAGGIADGFSNAGSGPSFASNGVFIAFSDELETATGNARMALLPSELRSLDGAGIPDSALGARASSFAPQTQTNPSIAETFAALGYNQRPDHAQPHGRKLEREWNLWADIRGTGWKADDTSGSGNDLKGNQINGTVGLGRKLDANTIIGAIVGYENFKYDVVTLNGELDGDGWTVGVYGARKFSNLRFDAAVVWSRVNYDAESGAASGSFHGSRWLAMTGMTGIYSFDAFVFEPSAKLYVLWERQGSWTDSLGTAQSSRKFSAGRAALGGQIGRAIATMNEWVVAPYAGFYGDWRFSSDDALPTGVPVANIEDGWSGRATTGIVATGRAGMQLMIGGELGGLGANYKIWSGNIRGVFPF